MVVDDRADFFFNSYFALQQYLKNRNAKNY